MIWEEVNEVGHYVFDIEIPEELFQATYYDTFIPYGQNPALNISPSVERAYYDTLISDYENPRNIQCPKHLNDLRELAIKKIPLENIIYNHTTSDIIRYIRREETTLTGPYKYHYDHFDNLVFMFFIYITTNLPVEGRELLIRKNNEEVFTVPVKNGRVVIMKTGATNFEHRVVPLKSKDPVILTTNYIWSLP